MGVIHWIQDFNFNLRDFWEICCVEEAVAGFIQSFSLSSFCEIEFELAFIIQEL